MRRTGPRERLAHACTKRRPFWMSSRAGTCIPRRRGHTVNHMVHYEASLDTTFAALSDATRRGVLAQLGASDASISDVAQKFRMTLTGMKKHVSVLEQAGLVSTEKVGRVRTCKLGPRRLEEEAAWIEQQRRLWNARFDALDDLVQQMKRQENANARHKQ